MNDIENFNNMKTDFDNPHRSRKYYIEFNRMLHSTRCIYFYIFLIISSITIFFYSLIAYFLKLKE